MIYLQPSIVAKDEKELFYVFRPANVSEVVPKIGSEDGTGTGTISEGGHSPALNPSGTHLAFVNMKHHIVVVRSDGNRMDMEKWQNGELINSSPVWSSNGRFVIFVSEVRNATKADTTQLHFAEVGKSSIEPLVDNESYNGFPLVSPDGKYLYFLSTAGASQGGATGSLGIWRLELESKFYAQ